MVDSCDDKWVCRMLMIEPPGQDDWVVQGHNGLRGRVAAQAVARQAWEPGQVGEQAAQ